MNRFILSAVLLFGLTACRDFSNRAYRYDDEIPLKSFVIQVTRTEYGIKRDKLVLKVRLRAANRSPVKNDLSRDRFSIRAGASPNALSSAPSTLLPISEHPASGQTREVTRDKTFLEDLGIETVSFNPGEEGVVTVAFVLPPDSLNQPIALIVDRRQEKGKERLTLVEIKKASPPRIPLVEGNWRATSSARWE